MILNVHKEEDIICILKEKDTHATIYKILIDGTMIEIDALKYDQLYRPYENFYIHSGQEEYISYMTVAPDGRLIEVNRFIAIHKNPGIQRVDGTKG
jgi:hypothetical protein